MSIYVQFWSCYCWKSWSYCHPQFQTFSFLSSCKSIFKGLVYIYLFIISGTSSRRLPSLSCPPPPHPSQLICDCCSAIRPCSDINRYFQNTTKLSIWPSQTLSLSHRLRWFTVIRCVYKCVSSTIGLQRRRRRQRHLSTANKCWSRWEKKQLIDLRGVPIRRSWISSSKMNHQQRHRRRLKHRQCCSRTHRNSRVWVHTNRRSLELDNHQKTVETSDLLIGNIWRDLILTSHDLDDGRMLPGGCRCIQNWLGYRQVRCPILYVYACGEKGEVYHIFNIMSRH